MYVGGDQGSTVVTKPRSSAINLVGDVPLVVECPISDVAILSGDSGRSVAGAGVPSGTIIDRVVPGVLFTLKKPNGTIVYPTGIMGSVLIGAVVHSPVSSSGTITAPYIIDDKVLSTDSGSMVYTVTGTPATITAIGYSYSPCGYYPGVICTTELFEYPSKSWNSSFIYIYWHSYCY